MKDTWQFIYSLIYFLFAIFEHHPLIIIMYHFTDNLHYNIWLFPACLMASVKRASQYMNDAQRTNYLIRSVSPAFNIPQTLSYI